MRLFDQGALKLASPEEEIAALNSSVLQQQVSLWMPNIKKDGFVHDNDVKFSTLISHILKPELLPEEVRETIGKVARGEGDKNELFGFCVATFPRESNGWVKRTKHGYATFTKLVQLDLDLKNEPDCTPEFVEGVIRDIFELTDLGQHILLCGKSISQRGVYLYVQCDTDDLAVLEVVITSIYKLLQATFNFQNPSKTLDSSVSDITSRLRYFAPDTDLVVNPHAIPLDTSGISARKKTYGASVPAPICNRFRELEVIKSTESRILSAYCVNRYSTGFHTAFHIFSCSCLGRGVRRDTLEAYTKEKYGQLYYHEKRKNYLPELLRVIDSSAKYISSK